MLLLPIVLILGSCGQPEPLEFDFLGVLEDAETADWVIDPADGSGSIGGPDGLHTVGPGTIWLAGGQRIEIGAQTKGGTFCSKLGGEDINRGDCVILGAFASRESHAWIATLPGPVVSVEPLEFQVGRIENIHGLDARVSVPEGMISLSVSPEARFDCREPGLIADQEVELPPAILHFAVVDVAWQVVQISCAYN